MYTIHGTCTFIYLMKYKLNDCPHRPTSGKCNISNLTNNEDITRTPSYRKVLMKTSIYKKL